MKLCKTDYTKQVKLLYKNLLHGKFSLFFFLIHLKCYISLAANERKAFHDMQQGTLMYLYFKGVQVLKVLRKKMHRKMLKTLMNAKYKTVFQVDTDINRSGPMFYI